MVAGKIGMILLEKITNLPIFLWPHDRKAASLVVEATSGSGRWRGDEKPSLLSGARNDHFFFRALQLIYGVL